MASAHAVRALACHLCKLCAPTAQVVRTDRISERLNGNSSYHNPHAHADDARRSCAAFGQGLLVQCAIDSGADYRTQGTDGCSFCWGCYAKEDGAEDGQDNKYGKDDLP